jgi:hypothetical protein
VQAIPKSVTPGIDLVLASPTHHRHESSYKFSLNSYVTLVPTSVSRQCCKHQRLGTAFALVPWRAHILLFLRCCLLSRWPLQHAGVIGAWFCSPTYQRRPSLNPSLLRVPPPLPSTGTAKLGLLLLGTASSKQRSGMG